MTLAEGLLLAARTVTGAAFLVIGLRNIASHGPISGAVGAANLPFPKLLAAGGIAVQIGFGALMMSGFYPVVAALGLLVFVIAATLIAHSFWTMAGEARQANTGMFFANLIMAGGLLALVAAGF